MPRWVGCEGLGRESSCTGNEGRRERFIDTAKTHASADQKVSKSRVECAHVHAALRERTRVARKDGRET